MTSLPSTAKPMVVNTAQVRMSVPIIPAQTMKQVKHTHYLQMELFPYSFIHSATTATDMHSQLM